MLHPSVNIRLPDQTYPPVSRPSNWTGYSYEFQKNTEKGVTVIACKSYNYSKLLEPIEINSMVLRNRITMSGMGTFTPMQDGTESEEGMRYYEERAKGGIAMIHTGATFLNAFLAQGSPGTAVDKVASIPKTTVMTERVHRWGAKMCLQLSPGTGRNTVLGDCNKPAKAGPAIREGFYAAMSIQ